MKLKKVTVHDIELEVSPDVFNDWEIVDLLDQIENEGKATRAAGLLRHVLGDEYRRVIDGLRDERGVASSDKVSEFLADLMKELAPN